MSKENTPYHPTSGDSSEEKAIDIEQSKLKDSYTEKIKDAYLPKSEADYIPSEESIERANDLDTSDPNKVSESNIVNTVSNS